MSYESFRPEILAKELMTDRGRDCVFKNLCYKGPIIGEITKKGDVLRIAGVGRPTVRDYTPGEDITLEQKKSYNQDLYITQAKYVNVEVDRVDKAQSQGEVFGVEVREAKKALAQTLDEYIAGFHEQAGGVIENTSCTSASVLSTLAEEEQALLEADVPFEEERFLVISPAIYTKLVLGKIVFQQANAEVFGKGFKGSYFKLRRICVQLHKKDGRRSPLHGVHAADDSACGADTRKHDRALQARKDFRGCVQGAASLRRHGDTTGRAYKS